MVRKTLTGSERNYSTYERELYAVVKSTESSQVYLFGREFTLRTDHQALIAIFRTNLATTTRIVKWVMRLQPYKFVIEVIPGKQNVVADALSRIPWPIQMVSGSKGEDVCAIGEEEDEEFNEFEEQEEFEADQVVEPVITLEQMLLAQRDDRSISTIKSWIEAQETPTKDQIQANSPEMRSFFQLLPNLQIERES